MVKASELIGSPLATQEEGSGVVTGTREINFVGDAVTVTDGGSGTSTVTVTASSGGSGSTTESDQINTAINSMRTLDVNSLGPRRMAYGIADSFEDSSGIDATESANETYVGASDLYEFVLEVQVAQGTGTIIGNMTANAGLAAVFDGDTVESGISESAWLGNSPDAGTAGKDWGSGVTKKVVSAKVYGASDQPIVRNTSNTATASTVSLQGSNDGSSYTTLASTSSTTGNADILTINAPDADAYRYHRISVASPDSSSDKIIAEIEFTERLENSQLQSSVTTMESSPQEVLLTIWEEDVDSITLNTDLIAYASRDGGTTFTQGTLEQVTDFENGRILKANIDLSSQPSGTDFVWRLGVLGDLNIRGVVADWAEVTSVSSAGVDSLQQGSGILVDASNSSSPKVSAKGRLGNYVAREWTTSPSAESASAATFRGLAWSPEKYLFVAVANGGTGDRVITSPDGINWTARSESNSAAWFDVRWAPSLSLFVSVAGDGGTGDRVMTSPDGITWTGRSAAEDENWLSLAWSPELSLFAAVSTTGTGSRVMTSPDGITWTSRTSPDTQTWVKVIWASYLQKFVATANGGTGDRVMTSPDGVTWTAQSASVDNAWLGLAASTELELLAAISTDGTGDRVMTSPDGVTWTTRVSPADNSWTDVIWVEELGIFVATSLSGTGNRIMTSPDGINWLTRSSASDSNYFAIEWSPEESMVVVAANGGAERIMRTL